MSALQKAEMDRSAQLLPISNIEKKITNHTSKPLSLAAAQLQLENCKKIQTALMDTHYRIIHLGLSEDDRKTHETEFTVLNDKLEAAMVQLMDIIRQQTPATTSSSSSSTATPPPPPAHHHLRLPDMQLPTFEGRFEDWPSFEDLFKATVDKNTSLSGAQKLQYLKACVTDDAGTLIKSFTITDGNYLEAWNLLSSRYDNRREIVYSLVKKILYQQHLKTESVSSLQALLNSTMECVRSLKVLKRPTDFWDDMLVVSVVEKLDPDTKAEWAKSLSGTDPSTFKMLTEFLEKHIRSLLAKGSSTTKVTINANKASSSSHSNSRHQARSHHSASGTQQCSLCNGSHQLFQCTKLKELPAGQRFLAVKKTPACINCLRDGHSARDCSSKNTCRQCHKKHHTLLHSPHQNQDSNSGNGQQEASTNSTSTPQQQVARSFTSSYSDQSTHVLLKTAVVYAKDSFAVQRSCRVLLDDGSEASFITEACAKSLSLSRSKADVIITGISATNAAHARWKTTLRLHSRIHEAYVDVEVLILPKVTGTLPRVQCNNTVWSHLSDLQLADPTYHQPGEIDILLGADVVASIMREGRRTGPTHSPIAQNSIFGWVLSGRVSSVQQTIVRVNHAMCELETLVKRFWEFESLPKRKPLTPDEAICETLFKKTTTRNMEGRYCVRLPFYKKYTGCAFESIGDTKSLAEHRLHQLEKRFSRNPTHHAAYVAFMNEYIALGHMELASPLPTAIFIPHHFVIKADSTTTKLRVVFDASMKSAKGISLNNMLMVGPTIQDPVFPVILRFRLNKVALKADVEKMYRQFEVHPDDRDYQRILWRESPDKPIQEYRLKTATYGTASAPYLATRCLKQLAEDESTNFPNAAAVVQSDMFVDDLLTGESSTIKAINLMKETIKLIKAGAMSIRKWCSNDPAVMQEIPVELREEEAEPMFDGDTTIKALGISWDPKLDTFKFYSMSTANPATKRELLSAIAKTFDPMGWLAPFTINAKIMFQEVWLLNVGWDDRLDKHYQDKWSSYQQQLKMVAQLQIPRFVATESSQHFELHGFSDASERACAAAIYLRCINEDGSITVNLLACRTTVAPAYQVSIPRLELCAALLLAETIDEIANSIKLKCTVACYTDSMIVLKWLQSRSKRWKTYVANRVAKIQEVVPAEQWRHVKGVENPADLPSRGISGEELISSSVWWHGPEWLSSVSIPITNDAIDMTQVLGEERATKEVVANLASQETPPITIWLQHFSTLKKAVSATAVHMLFIEYITKGTKFQLPLTPEQRRRALNLLIRKVQEAEFQSDLNSIRKSKEVSSGSRLKTLCPVYGFDEILRVGGRLQNAKVSEDIKHPIILPKHHHLTTLIIEDAHRRHMHGGDKLVMGALCEYWIIGARDTIRHILRRCVICRKIKATVMKQRMGQLPVARVTAHRPFLHTGVDFAGPYSIKTKKGRGGSTYKCYFAIYVCMATKAIHLEVVTDLTTSGFIASYRRFVARRGLCSHIYSDCGTNFIGAEKELREALSNSERELQQQLSHLGTNWHFNPPSAPHRGGLWEAGVKSVKHHLRRVMGESSLTLEQFQTLLCNVEACLNSRPLCNLSCDPTDFAALTPGHFLIGSPLTAIPEPDLLQLPTNRLDYWQRVQQLSQHFWKRWHVEYLSTLQQRFKWMKKEENISVGDLVLIKDDNLPPTRWRLGRVVTVHPSNDDLVRRVTLRIVVNAASNPVRYGEAIRPIQKLSRLLSSNEML